MNHEVLVGQEWEYDSGPSHGNIAQRFRIDAIGPRFAEVTFKNGRRATVELRILRRGLRHAKPVTT